MKKAITVIVAVGTMLYALNITHALGLYKTPTTSNQPTYNPGDRIIASRFKIPGYNDFVMFKRPDKSVWMFKCIAKEGDIVEIRHGKVYLNSQVLNEPFVWNEYFIKKDDLKNIEGYIKINKNLLNAFNDSLYTISLSDRELKEHHLKLSPRMLNKGDISANIFADFRSLGFNEDHLGPIKVPKNSYFLLGDSRHDAFDSRYIGFITNNDIIATVIN
jgi:signal peptidase I